MTLARGWNSFLVVIAIFALLAITAPAACYHIGLGASCSPTAACLIGCEGDSFFPCSIRNKQHFILNCQQPTTVPGAGRTACNDASTNPPTGPAGGSTYVCAETSLCPRTSTVCPTDPAKKVCGTSGQWYYSYYTFSLGEEVCP